MKEAIGFPGDMAAPASQLPTPGTFVTPQAGDGPGRINHIQKFFDPNTYRGKTMGLPPMGPRERMTDLTPETIRAFFDPETYRGKHVISPPLCSQYSKILSSHRDQKRPGEPAPTAQHGAKHQRLGKTELLDRFREAAELNGFVLEDLVATGPNNDDENIWHGPQNSEFPNLSLLDVPKIFFHIKPLLNYIYTHPVAKL